VEAWPIDWSPTSELNPAKLPSYTIILRRPSSGRSGTEWRCRISVRRNPLRAPRLSISLLGQSRCAPQHESRTVAVEGGGVAGQNQYQGENCSYVLHTDSFTLVMRLIIGLFGPRWQGEMCPQTTPGDVPAAADCAGGAARGRCSPPPGPATPLPRNRLTKYLYLSYLPVSHCPGPMHTQPGAVTFEKLYMKEITGACL